MSRPPRGTECVQCAERGHRCEAVLYASLVPGGRELPVCLPCADDEPCAVARCAGRGREVSAVSVERNVFGDVIDAIQSSEVVHRTPEELGVPREIAAPATRPHWVDRTVPLQREKRDPAPRSRTETRAGVEQSVKEEKPVAKRHFGGRGAGIPEDVKRAIREAAPEVTGKELAAKYGISVASVWKIRAEVRGKTSYGPARAEMVTLAVDSRIPRDEQPQPGTLAGATAQWGEGECVVLEVTRAQMDAIVAGLSPRQVARMIAAGLPAALAESRV